MPIIESDFTVQAVGTKLSTGTVQVCPHCGRNGLREETEGKIWFVHREGRGYNDIGAPMIYYDMCPRMFETSKDSAST